MPSECVLHKPSPFCIGCYRNFKKKWWLNFISSCSIIPGGLQPRKTTTRAETLPQDALSIVSNDLRGLQAVSGRCKRWIGTAMLWERNWAESRAKFFFSLLRTHKKYVIQIPGCHEKQEPQLCNMCNTHQRRHLTNCSPKTPASRFHPRKTIYCLHKPYSTNFGICQCSMVSACKIQHSYNWKGCKESCAVCFQSL